MSAIVLRVKFPPTYPLIYKTVRVDGSMLVRDAVLFIAESLRVNYGGSSIGLYVPEHRLWLDDARRLSSYPQLLEDLEYVEYRDRNAAAAADEGPCCSACSLM
eukprot:m51a1_g14364 hypothetical protein (103) ;mRNA; f:228373-228681